MPPTVHKNQATVKGTRKHNAGGKEQVHLLEMENIGLRASQQLLDKEWAAHQSAEGKAAVLKSLE